MIVITSLTTFAMQGCLTSDGQTKRDRNASRVIERHFEDLCTLPPDTLGDEPAALMAAEDVEALRSIIDSTERYFAAVSIGDIADCQVHYRTALERLAPEIIEEVKLAHQETERRILAKESRKEAELQAYRRQSPTTSFAERGLL